MYTYIFYVHDVVSHDVGVSVKPERAGCGPYGLLEAAAARAPICVDITWMRQFVIHRRL